MPESPSPRDRSTKLPSDKDPSKPVESSAGRKVAQSNRRELVKYAGLSTQVFLSVGLSLFVGIKTDKWLKTSFPIFAWALPLLVIVALIVKLIKETSGHGDRH
jgi:Na+/glutamate symporter